MVLFNNCGQGGYTAYNNDGLSLGSSGGKDALDNQPTCESELVKVYAQTWHPVLVQSCASCHSYGHGSSDPFTSYSGFTAKGETRIRANATTSHKGIGFSQNASVVNSFLPTWEEAKVVYQSCKASLQFELSDDNY